MIGPVTVAFDAIPMFIHRNAVFLVSIVRDLTANVTLSFLRLTIGTLGHVFCCQFLIETAFRLHFRVISCSVDHVGILVCEGNSVLNL